MDRLKAVLVALSMLRFQILVAPLLLFTARSGRGRMEGLFGTIFAVLVTCGALTLAYWLADDWPAPELAVAGLCVAGAAVLPASFLAAALARSCHFGEGPVGSHFLEKEPPKESLGWADTEDEYVWLLIQFGTRLDPWVPAAEAVAARDGVRDLVDAVRTHPDYHCLARSGGVSGYALLSGRFDPCHCYSYRPEPQFPEEQFGLLVFLHPYRGNYLVFLHALRPLADEHRLVLVCPSFGYGNWEDAGGVEAVERARRFACEAFPIDRSRVFLGGLSQGGAGVSRAAAASPELYAGLAFISATLEPAVVGSAAFAGGWHGRPVLVIHGEQDRGARTRTVITAVQLMQANGVKVTFHLDPEGGRYLFFAKLDEVRGMIGKWIDTTA